jgi:hypothetical protein
MQAIEFNSQLEHGQIAVPKSIHLEEGQLVRVLILLDEKARAKHSEKNVWERTAGAWQGERLIREPQGEYLNFRALHSMVKPPGFSGKYAQTSREKAHPLALMTRKSPQLRCPMIARW